MKKLLKKILIGGLIFICSTTNLLAIDPNGYSNGSKPANANASKIINYIQSKKQANTGTVFCIGEDTITYYESFFDEERDYYNLAFSQHLLSNLALSEQQKQVNPVNLQMKYEHNPSIYDNPVTKSGISGAWTNINVSWDSTKNKWKLVDPTSTILFEEPTDDKRGEWTIYLKGTDSTGKSVFDKETIGFAKFRVHKAPIPKFTFTDNGSTATLSDAGSYDIDYQYSKNSRRNVASDRQYSGIKEFYWSAKIGDSWIDLGTGASVTFNKSGQAVTDYKLTVEDYDGAFASISKSTLLLEKPLLDFEFKIGATNSIVSSYVYSGNVGHESLYINPLITWYDDGYRLDLYGTANGRGNRTAKFTFFRPAPATPKEESRTVNLSSITNESVIQSQTQSMLSSLTSGSNSILASEYTTLIRSNKIIAELYAANRYGLFNSIQKEIENIDIKINDVTENQAVCHISGTTCQLDITKDAVIQVKNANSKVKNNEIRMAIKIGSTEYPMSYTNNQYEVTIPQSVVEANSQPKAATHKYDTLSYTINVYSTRTNELLHQQAVIKNLHTPLDLKGYIKVNNSFKNNETTTEKIEVNAGEKVSYKATTNKYAKSVNLSILRADGSPIVTGDPSKYTNISLTQTTANNGFEWNVDVTLDSEDVSDEMAFKVVYEATSYNLRDKEYYTIEGQLLSYKLENFRVVNIRDIRLQNYYLENGKVVDKAIDVNGMGIDAHNFYPYPVSSLAKGYIFEFKIDSRNFNNDLDTIVITPSFYTMNSSVLYRDPDQKDAFWTDSNKNIYRVGEGGHSSYAKIVLTKDNRTKTTGNRATWRGKYYIPATTFLAQSGTDISVALANALSSDIIVNFNIEGYKNGVAKFNYNSLQWGKERSYEKVPYLIGDVIKYGEESNLSDLNVTRPR